MAISTDDIKELRTRTGISMIECKEALEESDGDIDQALKVLEKKSGAAAAKKAERDLGSGVVSAYVHSNNSVGAMIELRCETDFVARNDEFQNIAYEIAMHIAAMNPTYLHADEVPAETKEEIKEQFADELQGKPEEVQQQITKGKLGKYYAQHVLLNQPYIKDGDKTINDLIEEAVQKFGENIEIGNFSRLETLDR